MPENARSYLRPRGVERIFGRVLVVLVRIGLVRGHFYVLEVRGRQSGRTISLPVDPIDLDGRCHLVCARGNFNWVRNARAAGEVALVRALRRRRYAVRELSRHASTGAQSLSRPLRERGTALLPGAEGVGGGSVQRSRPRYPVLELQALGVTKQRSAISR
jgi:hypothetical protein